MQNKKNVVITVVAVTAALAVVGYRFIVGGSSPSEEEAFVAVETAALRELSAEVSYDVPGGDHTVSYTLYVDEAGTIQDVASRDILDPDHQENMDRFNEGLRTQIVGKKLSELEAIDKVGTSSLTTDSFNAALADLKAQI